MGKRFERLLSKIDAKIQRDALAAINKARSVFGGKPLKAIVLKGADDSIGGSSTPLGLSMKDVLTPAYADGSGFKEIAGLYCGVWEIPDAHIAARLARVWATETLMLSPLDYCCHRHADREKHRVVKLPTALQTYEEAVVDAADTASRCKCGCAWYERDYCTCGLPDDD